MSKSRRVPSEWLEAQHLCTSLGMASDPVPGDTCCCLRSGLIFGGQRRAHAAGALGGQRRVYAAANTAGGQLYAHDVPGPAVGPPADRNDAWSRELGPAPACLSSPDGLHGTPDRAPTWTPSSRPLLLGLPGASHGRGGPTDVGAAALCADTHTPAWLFFCGEHSEEEWGDEFSSFAGGGQQGGRPCIEVSKKPPTLTNTLHTHHAGSSNSDPSFSYSVISTPSSRQALVMVIPTTTEARGERRGEKTSPQRSPTAVIACTPSPTKVLDDPSASGSPGRRAPSSAVAARSTLGGIAPSAVKSLNVEVPDGLSVKKRREPTIAEAGSDKAREEAAGKKAEEEQARKREEAAKTAKAEEEARKVKLAEEARRAPEAQEEDKYRKLAEEASNREEETKARPAPKSVHEALALGDWVAFEKLLQTHPDKQAVLSKPVENPIICQVARGDGAAWFVRAVMRVDPWSVITQDSEHRGAIHIAANLGDFESCKALLDLKPERVKGPQLVSQLDKKKVPPAPPVHINAPLPTPAFCLGHRVVVLCEDAHLALSGPLTTKLFLFVQMHALHYAVLSGNEELVELMVAHGGERAAGVPNGQGMYPLHMACSKGMARAVAALCKIEGSDKVMMGRAVNTLDCCCVIEGAISLILRRFLVRVVSSRESCPIPDYFLSLSSLFPLLSLFPLYPICPPPPSLSFSLSFLFSLSFSLSFLFSFFFSPPLISPSLSPSLRVLAGGKRGQRGGRDAPPPRNAGGLRRRCSRPAGARRLPPQRPGQ